MEQRETEREEDKAYSMLGILDVYVATAYPEGYGNALRRVLDEYSYFEKCMQDLCITDPGDDKKRIEDTKGGLLEDSYSWILENADFHQWRGTTSNALLWVKGDPGKGKTMLLCGIIDQLERSNTKSCLLSYFFCQATDARINTATAVLRGLMYMLVCQKPSLTTHLRGKYSLAGRKAFEGANAWFTLRDMFFNILDDPHLDGAFIVIDALDECLEDLPKLLQFITAYSVANPRVKWIVSSRNWLQTEQQLDGTQSQVRLSLELNDNSIANAIDTYIKHKVAWLAQHNSYSAEIRDDVLEHLLQNAENTFLWVALVCDRLKIVSRRNVERILKEFPPGLNPLYERMLAQIHQSDNAYLCKYLLAAVAATYRPIRLHEVTTLGDILSSALVDLKEISEVVSLCGSFLTIRDDTIYFVHQSAKDFLTTDAAQQSLSFTPADVHHRITTESLHVLGLTLQRDMYNVQDPGCFIEEIRQPDPSPFLALRYSCVYWVEHMCEWLTVVDARYQGDLLSRVHDFLKQKCLYWFEMLSLCGAISEAVNSISELYVLLQSIHPYAELLHDICRFIKAHQQAIEKYPLQTYAAAFLFAPGKSLLREYFKHEDMQIITTRPLRAGERGVCLQILEGHDKAIVSMAVFDDSRRVLTISEDTTTKIWDTGSGQCLQTLLGHSQPVNTVVVSEDSRRIVTGSYDGTAEIWNADSGECLQTFIGHNGSIWSVAMFGNCRWVVTGSDDRTAKIWDSINGQCLHTLEGHNASIHSVAVSGNSRWVATGSSDGTARIWDTGSRMCLQILDIGKPAAHISFNASTGVFESSIGPLYFEAPSGRPTAANTLTPRRAHNQRLGISSDEKWITLASHNVVRLPYAYRPSCWVASEKVLVVGTATGHVWIYRIDM